MKQNTPLYPDHCLVRPRKEPTYKNLNLFSICPTPNPLNKHTGQAKAYQSTTYSKKQAIHLNKLKRSNSHQKQQSPLYLLLRTQNPQVSQKNNLTWLCFPSLFFSKTKKIEANNKDKEANAGCRGLSIYSCFSIFIYLFPGRDRWTAASSDSHSFSN